MDRFKEDRHQELEARRVLFGIVAAAPYNAVGRAFGSTHFLEWSDFFARNDGLTEIERQVQKWDRIRRGFRNFTDNWHGTIQ